MTARTTDPAAIAESCKFARDAWHQEGRAREPRLVTAFWYALGPGGRDQLDAYLATLVVSAAARVVRPVHRLSAVRPQADVHEALESLDVIPE